MLRVELLPRLERAQFAFFWEASKEVKAAISLLGILTNTCSAMGCSDRRKPDACGEERSPKTEEMSVERTSKVYMSSFDPVKPHKIFMAVTITA
jgi:hypothetical protein